MKEITEDKKKQVDTIIKVIISGVYLGDKEALESAFDDTTMENQSRANILIDKINILTKANYDIEIDNEYLYNFLRTDHHLFSFIVGVGEGGSVVKRAWLSRDGMEFLKNHYMKYLKKQQFKRFLDVKDHSDYLRSDEYINHYAFNRDENYTGINLDELIIQTRITREFLESKGFFSYMQLPLFESFKHRTLNVSCSLGYWANWHFSIWKNDSSTSDNSFKTTNYNFNQDDFNTILKLLKIDLTPELP